jgi:AmmeMemoRadiSam system protein B
MTLVRTPAVAGTFYPADPGALSREVDSMLNDAALPAVAGSVLGLLVPHAGYVYSGLTAAYAYSLLKKGAPPGVVLIIAPSHREYFKGISIYSGTAYRTPLGVVPLDEALRGELASRSPSIEVSVRGHGTEHSVEVQLPFLQKVSPGASILPIVMGDQHRQLCFQLGEAIAATLRGKNAVIIATSDLSHYHTYQEALVLDQIAIQDVASFDYQRLMEDLETERTEACGGGPAVAMLAAARSLGADRVEILHHCNSGDITGDRSGVVGYLAAAALRMN